MFSIDEWMIIRDALECKLSDVCFLRYCGGDVGEHASDLLGVMLDIYDRIDLMIGVADDEANSQDSVADFTKCTVSDLDQCSAGNEVSLDQHIQLYREVF